jgi:hypothetical protein
MVFSDFFYCRWKLFIDIISKNCVPPLTIAEILDFILWKALSHYLQCEIRHGEERN